MSDLSRQELAKIEQWRALPRQRPAEIEEPGPGQESVWDYPRPPLVQPVEEHLRVEFAGQVLAETDRALRVIETAGPPVYYFPAEDVRTDLLAPSDHQSLCEWKGRASYWHVTSGERREANAAFAYESPLEGFEQLEGMFAFYPQKVDACYLGDERIRPQPGRFYAGWISSKIVGPFKGEPGTQSW